MSSDIKIENAGIPKAMFIAVRKILRPLVRLFLHFRITFPQIADTLKSVYVEVAEEEFALPNKKQTDTRLSLLTGIYRKDIKRIRAEEKTDQSTPNNIDISTRIIARWISDTDYLDEKNQPASLPLQSVEKSLSFESLVEAVVKKDIRPRVVLDEWLNLGVVTLKDNNVALNTEAFIPNKGFDEKAFFVGHNIADHLAASADNLMSDEPQFFERCVYYDGLTDKSIQQLHDLISEKGMQTLLDINQLAMTLKSQDALKETSKKRINVGLYAYHDFENKNDD